MTEIKLHEGERDMTFLREKTKIKLRLKNIYKKKLKCENVIQSEIIITLFLGIFNKILRKYFLIETKRDKLNFQHSAL